VSRGIQTVIETLWQACRAGLRGNRKGASLFSHTTLMVSESLICPKHSLIGPLQPQGVVSCSNIARTRIKPPHCIV
jgi:hypothetical protein